MSKFIYYNENPKKLSIQSTLASSHQCLHLHTLIQNIKSELLTLSREINISTYLAGVKLAVCGFHEKFLGFSSFPKNNNKL